MDLIAVAPLLRDVITSEAHAEQARQTMRRILNAMQTLRSNAAEARSHLAREVENAARGCGTCQAVAASEHIRLAESIDVAEHTKYVALESEVVAIEEYIDAFERAFLAVADAVDTPAGFSSIRLTNSIPTVRAAALATPPARGPLESTAIKFITSKSVGRLGEILIPAAPSAADVLVQWRKVPRRVIPGHPLRLCLALSGAFRSQQFRRADVHAALNSLCNSVHVSLAIAESCEAGAAVHPVRHDIFPETVTVDLSEEQVNVSIAIPIDLCTTYFSGWELVLLAVSVGQDAVPQPFAFGNGAPLRLLIGAAHAKQQLGDVFEASKSGDVAALVKALIDGGSTEEASYDGRRPLHVASNAAVARVLLEAGAWVNASDNAGRTPLHWAALRRDASIVNSLLAHREADTQLRCWSSPSARKRHEAGDMSAKPLYTALAIAVARDPLGLDGESTKAIRAFSLRRVATMANEDSQFYGRKNGFCNQYCCKKQSDRPCFSRPQHVRNDGTIHYYREWISSISFADLWWPPVWRSSDLDFDVNCWNDTISTIEAEKTIREARQADRVEVKREFERRRHQTASRTLWATAPKAYY